MKIFRISNLEFKEECTGSYSGQKNVTIKAFDDDILLTYSPRMNSGALSSQGEVGYLSYSIFMDEIQIHYIHVDPSQRRKGVGTKLVRYLQSIYPGETIKWGNMTEEGVKLYESLGKNITKNPEFKEIKEKIKRLNKKLQELQSKADNFSINKSEGELFNKISDELYELNERLYDMKEESVIIL